MSSPKKARNKKYRPRAVNIPMMVETHDDLALGYRMAVEALIASPNVETYNAVSLKLVTLGRVVGPQDFMEAAKSAMLDVFARFERVGKIGASEPEASVLRETSRLMDAVIALIPVNKFAEAEAKTLRWCAANNVAP
jgi:hypothetical protein